MMFGNPSVYAIEAYHEYSTLSGVWGRMCLHIGSAAFGDIAEPYCMLDHAFEELAQLTEHTNHLWDEEFEELSDSDLYELLDTRLYRDDGRSVEEMRSDWCQYGRFHFLTNWGEMFDSAPKSFIVCPGSMIRVLWRDEAERHRSSEIPRSEFAVATGEACSWYRRQACNVF